MLTIGRWPSRPATAASAVRTPVSSSRKFAVRVVIHDLHWEAADDLGLKSFEHSNFLVDVKWKGPKTALGSRFRKSIVRGRTALQEHSVNCICWEEEFINDCILVPLSKPAGQPKEVRYQPWDVHFVIRKSPTGMSDKLTEAGVVFADIAQYAPEKETCSFTKDLDVILADTNGGGAVNAALRVTISMEAVRDDELMVAELAARFSLNSASERPAAPAPMPGVFASLSNEKLALVGGVSGEEEVLEDKQVKGGTRFGGIFSRSKERPSVILVPEEEAPEEAFGRREAVPGVGEEKDREKLGKGARLANLFGTMSVKIAGKPRPPLLLEVFDSSSAASSSAGNDDTEDEDASSHGHKPYGSVMGVNLAFALQSPLPELVPVASGEAARMCESAPPLSNRHGPSLSSSAGEEEALGAGMSDEEAGDVAAGEPARDGAGASLTSGKVPGSGPSGFLWRKRKLSLWSPKGPSTADSNTHPWESEPLLKPEREENGGDDNDDDRRREELAMQNHPLYYKLARLKTNPNGEEGWEAAAAASATAFGDVSSFRVGEWEPRVITSRSGTSRLYTHVFFASFDQRHASAAGEGACTALVAVICDWLHAHPGLTPTKGEFDALIREGSAEWRALCQVAAYRERFSDLHFDLETVVESAKVSLQVAPERSFVGFFRPFHGQAMAAPSAVAVPSFDFLEGAMSFENIWEEVEAAGSGIYIVSWNDHFFILIVEATRCFIIDTLGERLHEGCSQAFILKFESTTVIEPITVEPPPPPTVGPATASAPAGAAQLPLGALANDTTSIPDLDAGTDGSSPPGQSGALLTPPPTPPAAKLTAMSLCKLYVKEFLAAVPLGEVEKDLEKGRQVPLHQRLQVEFHFTTAGKSGQPIGGQPDDGKEVYSY